MTLYGSNHKQVIDKLKPKVDQSAIDIESINSKIPMNASATNQLVDRESLVDALSGSNATFRGNFNTKIALDSYIGEKLKNDYAVVLADENNNNETWRYKYNGTEWIAEYRVNETALTVDQSNALNSGITSNFVEKLNNILPANADETNKLTTQENLDELNSTLTDSLNTKLDKINPNGSGNFSIGRKEDSTTGTNSIAIGFNTESSGDYSVTIGRDNIASNTSSISIGNRNTVTGENAGAIAGFSNTIKSKSAISLGGEGLKASSSYQTVQGKYNVEDASSTFVNIIGNGTNDTERSNVAALDWSGNLYLGGTVYIDSDSTSQNGTSLSEYIATNTSLKLTGILYAGETSLILKNNKITADMMVDIYASIYGIQPVDVLVEEGKVILTFDPAFDQNVTIGVKFENFTNAARADIPENIKLSFNARISHLENSFDLFDTLYYSGSFISSNLIQKSNYCFNGIVQQKLYNSNEIAFFTDSDFILNDKKININNLATEDMQKVNETGRTPTELTNMNNPGNNISFIWSN